MMVDTTVYGYYFPEQGTILCRPCALGDGTAMTRYCPKHGNEVVTEMDGDEHAHGLPLFSVEDDGRGMTCDGCCEFIFEPDDDYCADCDDWHEFAGEHEEV